MFKEQKVRSDEARKRFRELLNAVENRGEHITILRYDTPSAVLVPAGWHTAARDLRAEVAELRSVAYEYACDLADEGKPGEERAFGRVEAYDEVMRYMDRNETPATPETVKDPP